MIDYAREVFGTTILVMVIAFIGVYGGIWLIDRLFYGGKYYDD